MINKIIVVTGSSHENGTSAKLADNFIKGAQEAENTVKRFDAGIIGKKNNAAIIPQYVDAGEMGIPTNDQIQELIPELEDCDMIVLVTPLYYYGPTAQLKSVIDRFYSYNHYMKDKKSAFLVTAYDPVEKFKAIDTWYDTLIDYMRWDDQGKVYAGQAWSQLSKYEKQAYQLGKSIN